MGDKTGKHDFSQRKGNISKEDYEIRKLSRNFQRGNTKEQRRELAFNLLDSMRQFADVSIRVVREELLKLGVKCDIIEDKRNHTGNYMYHINKQGIPLQPAQNPAEIEGDNAGQGQITFTVIKNGTFKVRLNPYGENDKYIYYHADGLNTKDLVGEIETLQGFLSDGTVPSSTSKFTKENETNNSHLSEADLDDLLENYEVGSVK